MSGSEKLYINRLFVPPFELDLSKKLIGLKKIRKKLPPFEQSGSFGLNPHPSTISKRAP